MSTAVECNTIPPVVVEGYVEKGTWIELAGLKVYVTGSENSSRGVVDIYDIFGPAPQTLQGADLLATALNAIVIVPDFFKGLYKKHEWTTNPTEETEKLQATFQQLSGDFEGHGKKLKDVVKAGSEKWGSVKNWGALGLCWGGKLAVLGSAEGTPFKVTGQVHPGRYAKEDAEKVTIPHIVLASKNENVEVTKAYAEILVGEGKTGEVETYSTMHHGWMGARADFKDEANLKEYERGYNQIIKFFTPYL